jgi:HSP20 family protein
MAETCWFLLPTYQESRWRPAVDIYRRENAWLVKCDLAGVRPQEVQLTVGDRCLTIAGVRRDWSIADGCRAYSLEIVYSSFERTIELPFDGAGAEISTDYCDGMLLVLLTQKQEG